MDSTTKSRQDCRSETRLSDRQRDFSMVLGTDMSSDCLSQVGAVASCCGAVVERIVWLQQTNLCPWKNPEAASNRQVGNKPTLHPYYLNLSLEVKVKSKSNYSKYSR